MVRRSERSKWKQLPNHNHYHPSRKGLLPRNALAKKLVHDCVAAGVPAFGAASEDVIGLSDGAMVAGAAHAVPHAPF